MRTRILRRRNLINAALGVILCVEVVYIGRVLKRSEALSEIRPLAAAIEKAKGAQQVTVISHPDSAPVIKPHAPPLVRRMVFDRSPEALRLGHAISQAHQTTAYASLTAQCSEREIQIRYALLFHQLAISPRVQHRLERLLSNVTNLAGDVNRTVGDLVTHNRISLLESMALARATMQSESASLDSQIRALLGPDGYPKYVEYQAHLPQYMLVSEVNQRLAITGDPLLTDDQIRSLASVLINNQTIAPATELYAYIQTPNPAVPDFMNSSFFVAVVGGNFVDINSSGEIHSFADITPTTLAAARSFLEPHQMAALSGIATSLQRARLRSPNYDHSNQINILNDVTP